MRAGGLARRAPAWTITAALGLCYVIAAPPSADLAAASYRSQPVRARGFTLWDNSWYGGHHLPAYSVLAPALGWLIGPLALAAVSMTVAAALFAALIEGRFPAPAVRIAGVWFALGAAIGLLASRVPFDLGLAIGLGSLVLAQRGRRGPALVLAVVCALASPVAGAFLALAALAWALGGGMAAPAADAGGGGARADRGADAGLPGRGLAAVRGLGLLPGAVGVLVIAAVIEPRAARAADRRAAVCGRAGRLLPDPHARSGGNIDRLGALVAGPIAACVLAGTTVRRGRAAARARAVPVLLAGERPRGGLRLGRRRPGRARLLLHARCSASCERSGVGYSARPARIEVVPTRDHWEARFVAPHVAIARGWERQLDIYRNGLFYAQRPADRGALPRVAVRRGDRLRRALRCAARLLRARPRRGSLRSGSPGRLPARSVALGSTGACSRCRQRVRWRGARGADAARNRLLHAQRAGGRDAIRCACASRSYWALSQGRGCVREAPGGWTRIEASRAGSLHVVISFSLGARVRPWPPLPLSID